MAFLQFVLRRAGRHWQLLLTLSLGVLLTTALLASGPLLVDAVVEMGLYRTLTASDPAHANLRLVTATRVDRKNVPALDREIQDFLRSALGDHLARVVRSAQSPWIFVWSGGRLDERVRLYAYDDVQNQVAYAAGEWPGRPSDDPNVIRAVIGDEMSRSFGLRVGDRLPLSPAQDSAVPALWIEVTGIVRPRDPLDPYWFGELGPFATLGTGQYNVIVPEQDLERVADRLFPQGDIERAWYVLLRPDTIGAGDIEPFRAQLVALQAQLDKREPRVTLETGVLDILTGFQKQFESIRLPLYILIAEIMLLGLYFVTMVTDLAMHQIEREFAVLRSRGALNSQIVRLQLVEALIMLGAAFLAGPWLGAGFVQVLSRVGPLADLRAGAGLTLQVTPNAWLAAGLGSLVCLAGLLLPLGPTLRRSIVTQQQMSGRVSTPPWWQRLYLDVFVLVGGILLLWRLRLYGEMTTGGAGGARVDWLLLLAPIALLLGSATVLLRVFPLVLRAFAALAARSRGLAGILALWQTSRNPTHVTRLVLLLTLAIALGILANGLNATLDQSERDRAYYLAGNDIRLASQSAIPLIDVQSTPGVLELSGVWRGSGTINLPSAKKQPAFEALAVDPESFSKVTRYRNDFADQPMGELLNRLRVPAGHNPTLLPLPGTPAKFGLWLQGKVEDKTELNSFQQGFAGDDDAERVGVVAKLQTAQGELFTVRMQRPEITRQGALQTDRLTLDMNPSGRDVELNFQIKPDNQGWHYFEASLPAMPATGYPLSMHSLWLENQATHLGQPISKTLSLVMDDLTVVDAKTGQRQVFESFETSSRPMFLGATQGSAVTTGLVTYPTAASAHTGQFGQFMTVSFTQPVQTIAMRLRQDLTRAPLPALVSPAFLQATQLHAGDFVRASIDAADIDFQIVGAVRYFPTLFEQSEAGFLVTSRDLLLPRLNENVQAPINPNEVLVQTAGGVTAENLARRVPMLSQSWQAESVRQTLKANPLALGLRSVTFLASRLTLLLSLVGFATHFYLTAREREMLYGVMRAMGMSARQVYGSLVFEQAVLILAGLALGMGLGTLLNEITLPRLPVQLADRPPVPPFIPREDWLAMGSLYLGLAMAFLGMLGIVTALLRRAHLDRIMRIGQE